LLDEIVLSVLFTALSLFKILPNDRTRYMLATHAVVLLCLQLHVVGLRLFSHFEVIRLTHRFVSTTAASVLEPLNRPKYPEINPYNETRIRPWSITL
jgi:hypothetical protein